MTTIVTRRTYCDICNAEKKESECMRIETFDIPDVSDGRRVNLYHVCKDCSVKVRTLFIGKGNTEEDE